MTAVRDDSRRTTKAVESRFLRTARSRVPPLAVIEAVVELAERFGSKVATAAEARKLMKIGAFVLGIRNSSGEVSRRVNTRWLLRMPTRGTVRSRDSVSSRPKHR